MSPRRDPFEPRPARSAKPIPFAFVLDELAPLSPTTRPMFGCTAVYVGERIVFILRDKRDGDDGVWVAIAEGALGEVTRLFPTLRPIAVLPPSTSWRRLPARSPTFEEDVGRAVALVLRGDPRLGKVPRKRAAKARR